jgi:hypothetical protein
LPLAGVGTCNFVEGEAREGQIRFPPSCHFDLDLSLHRALILQHAAGLDALRFKRKQKQHHTQLDAISIQRPMGRWAWPEVWTISVAFILVKMQSAAACQLIGPAPRWCQSRYSLPLTGIDTPNFVWEIVKARECEKCGCPLHGPHSLNFLFY